MGHTHTNANVMAHTPVSIAKLNQILIHQVKIYTLSKQLLNIVQNTERLACDSDKFDYVCPRLPGQPVSTIRVDMFLYGMTAPTDSQALLDGCDRPIGEMSCIADNGLALMRQR
jgi:hypothetical protein